MLEPQPFKASEARLRKISPRLANDLARPANDSINGVFDEKSKKLPFLAAGHANIWQKLGVLYFTNGAVCSAEVIPGGSSMIFMFRK